MANFHGRRRLLAPRLIEGIQAVCPLSSLEVEVELLVLDGLVGSAALAVGVDVGGGTA